MVYRTVICVLLVVLLGCGMGQSDEVAVSEVAAPEAMSFEVTDSEVSASEATDSEATVSEVQVPEAPAQIVSPLMAMSVVHEVYGPSTLEERALRSDLVVRARLQSKTATYRRTFDQIPTSLVYFAYVEFTFEVLEVLHGNAGDSVVVELEVSEPYSNHHQKIGLDFTTTDATQRATDWLVSEYYDSQWEDRDAILFLVDIENASGYYLEERPDTVGYAFVGHRYYTDASATDGDDWFSIASAENKVWIPATSTTEGAATFYLESPDVEQDPETETLSSLKSSVTTAVSVIDTSIPGHRDCLVAKKRDERKIKPAGYAYANEIELASGLPAGTVVVPRTGGGGAGSYWYYHLYREDAVYFDTAVTDTDTDPSNGYDGSTKTVRPLPGGRYVVEEARQLEVMVPCKYIPDERGRWTFNVSSPEGTLHELFFDPVNQSGAVKADASNGILKPATFTAANGASATLSSISYEAGTVELEVTPDNALDDHILDIIELDGAVSLSLDVGDAVVDGEDGVLRWSVAEQPWEDGDLLMVRIREAR